jgi:hypothetical protein
MAATFFGGVPPANNFLAAASLSVDILRGRHPRGLVGERRQDPHLSAPESGCARTLLKHRKSRNSSRTCRIDRLAEALETDAPVFKLFDRRDQMRERTLETIKPIDHDHIAASGELDRLIQVGPINRCPGGNIAKQLLAVGLGQGIASLPGDPPPPADLCLQGV